MEPRRWEGIETGGDALRAMIEGVKLAPSVATKYLVKLGVLKPGQSLDPREWYPTEGCVLAYHAIAKEVGPSTAYQIGRKVPETAEFPPEVEDLYAALCSIDIAYHMNHRRCGAVMFDPATGAMLEGIGHYRCTLDEGLRRIVCVADNPYPCDFDLGIVAAIAARFEMRANVVHDEKKPCRKRGEDSCTYVVSW